MTGAEGSAEAWFETLRVDVRDAFQTAPSTTIVPRPGATSSARAFLDKITALGMPVELRTGRVIGEGGMGIVREAEQVALGRVVAIKTLKPGHTTTAADELLREAWVTGALEHPNIVPVHHLGADDTGMPLLILKRVEGVEWSALIADGAEIERRFGTTDLLAWNLGILNQVLNALRFAHSKGILHRDLKPQNVMIGNFGEVYLLDWGIAVSLRDDATGRFPRVGDAPELAGTPCYMAPEMLGRDSGPRLSERTDVYLAGAVVYQLIAGHPPHRGTHVFEVIASVVTSKPALPADAPPELAQICAHAMDADPAKRFDSIEALQLALAGYLEHRGSAQLAAHAGNRLDEMLAMLATADGRQREEVYRQLAICRFGFHEALAVWKGNVDARAGLTRATVAVAEYELAHGDPRAAVRLLSELDEPPALLDRAQAAAADATARQHHLEQLRDDLDPIEGSGPRWVAGIALGVVYSLFPLVSALYPDKIGIRSHEQQLGTSTMFLVLVALLAAWRSRRPMTAIDRRIFATGAFLFVSQILLGSGGWALGLSVETLQVFMMFLWSVIAGMMAITIDRYLAFAAVGYVVGFLIAARDPSLRLYMMSATNVVFAANVAWRWRPARLRLTERDRPRAT